MSNIDISRIEADAIAGYANKHQVTLSQIKKPQMKNYKKSEEDLKVCAFHSDLSQRYILFNAERQAEILGIDADDVKRRIRYYQNRVYVL